MKTRESFPVALIQAVRNERGAALITALVLMVAMLTLTVALMGTGGDETTVAANHFRATQATLLAEAGLEVAYTTLRTNVALVKGAPKTATSLALPALSGGGTYAVQYRAGVEPNTIMVAATGQEPGGATKTLRTIMTTNFHSKHAILIGGDLKIKEHARIMGECGAVHANGDVESDLHDHDEPKGGRVQKALTASGSYKNKHDTQVGANSGGGKPTKEIPVINPADFFNAATSDVAAGILPANEVFNFKADGQVLDGNGTLLTTIPKGKKYNGWKYEPGDKSHPAKWEHEGKEKDAIVNGTYYFEGDAKIDGDFKGKGLWTVTILAAQTIEIKGKADMSQHLRDALIVAGGDLKINADKEGSLGLEELIDSGETPIGGTGLIAAHEMIKIEGKVHINGYILAEGVSATDSSVKKISEVTDRVQITYNCGGLRAPLQSSLRLGAWGL